jgi:hypothetical protein
MIFTEAEAEVSIIHFGTNYILTLIEMKVIIALLYETVINVHWVMFYKLALNSRYIFCKF